ncbi:MerR family transcriptional regulator [Phenylobacterium sp.]|uniref:MerR family transcriptional regulator n=1 Tax=Phenylobacterium sp. TaxID=1871053 RepID=UPI00271A8B17|nr:MerR family transcriptional regulator [Phenylobacterium sp.]MDO8381162.1 MerR family transcriptional regulator [Phenylobacterium sp.]
MAKGPDAFRTISEAADELGVPQHVLRFWETKFSFIRPMKRAGGRRFYRPQDIAVLRGVKTLLHDDGYTIKGVQRLHKEQGLKRLLAAANGEGAPPPAPARDEGPILGLSSAHLGSDGRERLVFALDDLQAAKRRLDALLKR